MSIPVENATELRLFPTSVWIAQTSRHFFESLNSDIRALLDQTQADSPDLEARDQWQTGQDLHETPAMQPLVDLINQQAAEICRVLTLEYDRFEITGCWANVSKPGYDHRAHYHPNNFLSGAYYVSIGGGADSIDFHDPRPQAGMIVPPARDQNRANPDKFSLQVREGMLAMFPAWLVHSVPANEGNVTRISVAFNIMFPDFGSRMANPLWQADTK